MKDNSIELQRCRDIHQLEEVTDVLKAAGIPYDLKSTAPNFDLASLGSGSTAEVVIRVSVDSFDDARSALEGEYLKVDLPDDHYLMSSTDEDIIDIVANSSDWSPHDVAHARRIMKDRNIDPSKVRVQESLRLNNYQQGKKAPLYLLIMGWFFTVMGGFIGLGIAWSLCTMTEKTPEGEFYTYDEASRAIGKNMAKVALVVSIVLLLLKMPSSE